MATYEIKKETRVNGDRFLYLFINGQKVIDSVYDIKESIQPESEGIEKLKSMIENHKKTGLTDIIETIYSDKGGDQ